MARPGYTAQRFGTPVHYHITCTDAEYYDNDARHCYTKTEHVKVYANMAAHKAMQAGEHVINNGMKHLPDTLKFSGMSVDVYLYRNYQAKITIHAVPTHACQGHLHTSGSNCRVYGCTGFRDW